MTDRAVLMRILAAFALLAVQFPAARADEGEVHTLRLRAAAAVSGSVVTLGDVLDLTRAGNDLATRLASIEIATSERTPATLGVSHEQVSAKLAELGVNQARVMLSGAARCEVRLEPPAGDPVAPTAAPTTDAAPLIREKPAAAGSRLEDLIRAHIERECASLEGEVDVRFEVASQQFLSLTNPPFEFRITSIGRERLGVREFNVVIRGEGQTGRPVRVACRVALIRQVVAAQRPLNLGAFIKRDDLTYQQRRFDREADFGCAKIEALVGQQVAAFVPVGEMVPTQAVKAVDLVKRGDDVTVLGGTSGVSMTLRGKALESGTYGDTVRVQIGKTRQDRTVRRGVVVEYGKIRLLGENS